MNNHGSTSRSNMFSRILGTNEPTNTAAEDSLPINTDIMITKVTVRPNPFYTVLTLDVTCAANRNIIVRMFSEDGRIVKMFSWYLVKGTNITAINQLGNLENGLFLLDIIDNEGKVLFSTKLDKA